MIPGALVLFWSLIQLARDPTFFWCDDFQAEYLPFFEEVVRSWRDGEWPLLSRNSWCAGNLAGEFQLGTFAPHFNLLLLAVWSFPLSLSMKAAVIASAHLIWMATGVFVLGRLRGLPVALATMAALATTLSGWIITWAATDWISFLIGSSWVPWVWWSLETAIASDSVWKRWLRPALFVALLTTTGHSFGIAMIPVIGAWLAARAIIRDRNWRVLGPLVVAGVLGLGLSAPAWWLAIDYVTNSARWDWGSVVQYSFMVPWRAWPGLVLPSFVTPWPNFIGMPEPHASMELACGLVPVAALTAAFIFRPLVTLRKLRWELILLVVSVLLASLPSIGQFRYSFRWLPLFHLVLALTAGAALQEGIALRAAVVGAGLTAVTWAGAALFAENRSPALAGSLLGLSVAWCLAARFARRDWADWVPVLVVAISLSLTFWFLPTHQAVPKYSFSDKILDPAPLDPARLYLSLHSIDEITHAREREAGFGNIVRPFDTMHYAGLRFLNGYTSFPGREVRGLFHQMGFVHPGVAESLAGPKGERLLLFLGVDGIVFSSDYLPFARTLGPEWKKVAEAPEGAVFHRDPARFTPVKTLKYLFDRPGVPLADPVVQLIGERRNSVTVEITPSAFAPVVPDGTPPTGASAIAPIAFVRPFFRGYRAFLNGVPIPVREYRNILPLVELPADARGTLELRYRPPELIHGLMLTAASLGVMLLIAVFGCKRSAARPSTGSSRENQ